MTDVGLTALSVEIITNALDAVARRRASATTARADDVVLDRLARVPLHHRHVLVRRGVEDDARAGAASNTCVHPRRVADVGDARLDRRRPGTRRSELAVDLEQRVLGRSTSTSRCGPKRQTWRHSSEPMLPPAPVTSTTRLADRALDDRPRRAGPARGRAGPRSRPRGCATGSPCRRRSRRCPG